MFRGVRRDATPLASEAGKLKTGLERGEPESEDDDAGEREEELDGRTSSAVNTGDRWPGDEELDDVVEESKLHPKAASPCKLVGRCATRDGEEEAAAAAVSILCCCCWLV